MVCHSERVEEFQVSVTKAIKFAKVLGVNQLNCLAGIALSGIESELLRKTFIENLRYAVTEL
uniref:Hydroxypyruvate isomerase n=1 Tax=Polynucleobacter necessarius subsp. necessarius (strain STIR1) TaxID=452638 RepID=B1XUR4_POLNS